MAGVKFTISGDGKSFRVDDACTADSTACAQTWDALFGAVATQDVSTFKHTEKYLETEELPPLEDTIEIDTEG